MAKKQRREENRKHREEVQFEKHEKGDPKIISQAIILSIESGYITYRQFKMIQEFIDSKYDKPCWARRQPDWSKQ